jgi:glycosyltransferase involved in cell wall biosynthesis
MTTVRIFVVAGLAQSLTNFRGPLLRSMIAAGHQVMAAAPDLTPVSQTAVTLEAAGIKTYDLALSRNGLNPFADLWTFWRLFRLFRRTRPEVLLAYTIKPVVWAGLAARISGTGRFYALITGLGYAFTGKARGKKAVMRKIAIFLYRLALSRAAGVIFQNPDDAAEFRSLGILPNGDQKVFIVNGSGVDTDHFTPAGFPDGPVTFVLIARLLGDKGVREFAAAAGILRDRGVAAKFRLVGGTDSNADSIHPNEAKGWQENGLLDWRGPREDVRPEIAAAHVMVLSS